MFCSGNGAKGTLLTLPVPPPYCGKSRLASVVNMGLGQSNVSRATLSPYPNTDVSQSTVSHPYATTSQNSPSSPSVCVGECDVVPTYSAVSQILSSAPNPNMDGSSQSSVPHLFTTSQNSPSSSSLGLRQSDTSPTCEPGSVNQVLSSAPYPNMDGSSQSSVPHLFTTSQSSPSSSSLGLRHSDMSPTCEPGSVSQILSSALYLNMDVSQSPVSHLYATTSQNSPSSSSMGLRPSDVLPASTTQFTPSTPATHVDIDQPSGSCHLSSVQRTPQTGGLGQYYVQSPCTIANHNVMSHNASNGNNTRMHGVQFPIDNDMSINAKLDLLLQMISDVQQSVQQHMAMCKSGNTNDDLELEDFGLPVDSEDSIASLENELRDKAKRSQLVCYYNLLSFYAIFTVI